MKKVLLLTAFALAVFSASAQHRGDPTYHDDYANYYLMAGYQRLNHPTGEYNVATIQAEVLYSFAGSRISLTTGSDYLSFSPCGIFMFAPRILMNTLEGEVENPALLPFLFISLSALQWHFPLTSHLEVNLGWDAMKFTKLKNYSDTFFITGSINGGVTCFIGNHFFLNGYYEFNHTHNPLISVINWAFRESPNDPYEVFSKQPTVLRGHSFGVRIGWMF